MPTHSPESSPSAATPAALSPPALSSALAVYLKQKRAFSARRGADLLGGVAVPRIHATDALELVRWWSSMVPALVAGEAGDPAVSEWTRCGLTVRGAVAAGVVDVYADRARLWRCIKALALAADTRNVAAPSWSEASGAVRRLGELAAGAKQGAGDASAAVGAVSSAVASGASKVSSAAGRGAGEGAIRGALSAAAVPAAIAGVALAGGFFIWRWSRDAEPEEEAKPRKKRAGGRR